MFLVLFINSSTSSSLEEPALNSIRTSSRDFLLLDSINSLSPSAELSRMSLKQPEDKSSSLLQPSPTTRDSLLSPSSPCVLLKSLKLLERESSPLVDKSSPSINLPSRHLLVRNMFKCKEQQIITKEAE